MKNAKKLAFIGSIVGVATLFIFMIVHLVASFFFNVAGLFVSLFLIAQFVLYLIHFLDKKPQPNMLLPLIGSGCGLVGMTITFFVSAIGGGTALGWLSLINVLLGCGCLGAHYFAEFRNIQNPIFKLLGLAGCAACLFGWFFSFIGGLTFFAWGGWVTVLEATGVMAAFGLILPVFLPAIQALKKK